MLTSPCDDPIGVLWFSTLYNLARGLHTMADGPLPFKGNRGSKWNVESAETTKSSFKVEADPKTYRRGTFGRSATNPGNVGCAGPDRGPTSGD